MQQKRHNGHLAIEGSEVSFRGIWGPESRHVFSSLVPWEELEETYAPQFSPTSGAPASTD